VITARHLKHAPRARELSLFHVLDPGAIYAQGHVILGLARNGAGMAADAFPVIDDEAVSHDKACLVPKRLTAQQRLASQSQTQSPRESGHARQLVACEFGFHPRYLGGIKLQGSTDRLHFFIKPTAERPRSPTS
jgi:hypothetical protein